MLVVLKTAVSPFVVELVLPGTAPDQFPALDQTVSTAPVQFDPVGAATGVESWKLLA